MSLIVDSLRVCAVVQAGLMLASPPVLRRIDARGQIAGASLFVRQMFWFHYAWIAATVVAFAALDAAFAPALAGGSALGRSLAAGIGTLWAGRLATQVLVYDKALRRRHRGIDVAYSLVFAGLALVHLAAAVLPGAGGAS